MKKKKLSQKSRRQFREIRDFYYRLGSVKEKLEMEIDPESQEAMEFIERVYPWANLYSLPAKELTAMTLYVLGFLDGLVEAVRSSQPTESLVKFCNEVYEGEHDEEYEEAFEDYTDDEWGWYLAMVFAMFGNIEGMKAYYKPVSTLVEEAKTNKKSLMRAVSVDRSVITHPVVAKKISIAQIMDNESLMNDLARALTRTIPRSSQKLDDFRYMAEILDEMEGLKTYSYEELADFFINELDVFQEELGGDGTSAIKKLLQRRKKAIGT